MQFYALAFAIAIVMGGALSRMFSHVIRAAGKPNFSLYEISDKGATFLGSLRSLWLCRSPTATARRSSHC